MNAIKAAGYWGIYFFEGETYMVDDFGNLIQVTFEQLGRIDIYRNQEH